MTVLLYLTHKQQMPAKVITGIEENSLSVKRQQVKAA